MTSTSFDAAAVAQFIAQAHEKRQTYRNLPAELAPRHVSDAYAAQEALRKLWEPIYGPVAGWKIATTTKVMQALMGIDHPCGGMIYSRRIHASPMHLNLSRHMHVVVECELAVRLKSTLAAKGTPWTAAEVRREVAEVMPAYELIEDRNAIYKETSALTLIADNAWNAGIVLGKPITVSPDRELNGLKSRLETPSGVKEGATDDPMGALAWVVNLGVERGRPVQSGQVVITGSVVQTLPIAAGERFVFSIDGLGSIEMDAAA
jgi:2-keto-4-pentenoate hydratase